MTLTRRGTPQYSRALLQGNDLLAVALVWGDPARDEEPEISIASIPYSSPEAWWAKERLLAELVGLMADGDRFMVDAHLSMRTEYELIGAIPGLRDPEAEGWTAIVAVPLGRDDGAIVALDPVLIPDDAGWARRFA